MKKISYFILVLMLLSTLLLGCTKKNSEPIVNDNQETTDENTSNTDSENDVEAPDTSSETSEPTDTNDTTQTDTGIVAIPKDEIKIGVIYISDPAEGTGYTYTHDQGVVAMQKALGLADKQIVRKINISDNDVEVVKGAMEESIKDGCNVIFATSLGYEEVSSALAKEYPEVIFLQAGGQKSDAINYGSYAGRMYQAEYLTGIVAGLQTKFNKIGYVVTGGTDNAEVTAGVNAFAIGVNSVNPDAQVLVKSTNESYNPNSEKAAAETLIAQGCDIIGQHSYSPYPQIAAEEAGVWGIGYSSDMSVDAPSIVLTSAIWNWTDYYKNTVDSIINGTWTNDTYFGSMKDGIVSITPLSANCSTAIQDAVSAAKQKLVTGSFDVFTGVLTTNDGKSIGVDGKSLDDDTIMHRINWYYKNVVVK